MVYPPLSAQLIASSTTLIGMMFISLLFLLQLRRIRAPRPPRAIAAARPVLYGQILGADAEGDADDAEELELIVPAGVVQGVRVPYVEQAGGDDGPHGEEGLEGSAAAQRGGVPSGDAPLAPAADTDAVQPLEPDAERRGSTDVDV